MPNTLVNERCLVLCPESDQPDLYREFRVVREGGLLGRCLSGLGFGQKGFSTHSAQALLETAGARLGEMLVIADWCLLGTTGDIINVLEGCDLAVRAEYSSAMDYRGHMPVMVSVSTYVSLEVTRQIRSSKFGIMLALVGPPCDVLDSQLGVDGQSARDDEIFKLLANHYDQAWLKPTARPVEFAIVPASLVLRLAEAWPGLGRIACLKGAEGTPVQIRQALEAGAHRVMIDWQPGAASREELVVYCRAIAEELDPVLPVKRHREARKTRRRIPEISAEGGLRLLA